MIKLILRSLYYWGRFLIILHLVLPPAVFAAVKPSEVIKQNQKITKCRDGEKHEDKMPKILSKCRVSSDKISGCTTRCLLYQSGFITKDYKKFVDDSKLAKNLVKLQGFTDKTAKKLLPELKKLNCKGKIPKPSECSKYEAVLACTHVALKKVC